LLSEGRRWLDRLLEVDATPTLARAHALWANGALAILQGDVESARAMLAESRRLAEELADDSARAYTRVFSGQVAMVEGDIAAAAHHLEQAVEEHRETGDAFGVSVAVIRLALAASAMGDGERARQLATDYVDLCSEHGATWLAAFGHFVLAVEHWRRGELEIAVDEARVAVRVHWTNRDRIGAAEAMEVLAWAAAAHGDAQRAVRLLGALDGVWRTVGAALLGFPYLVGYHDECVARCRRMLGAAAFDAAADRGARLGFDDVVAYALEAATTRSIPSDQASSPLTRRESQVADLVAQGMSNKEIAASLVISLRTAEGHVEHILTKLGFTSRAQIATWVTARKHAAAPPAIHQP
jgi:ATP/maltotriose-dependent transcriptional regulator MalT